MGIHGLAKLIADVAPNAIKENELKNYFGMDTLRLEPNMLHYFAGIY